MIPVYINQWLNVIENMNNENTYKLAWGRAIIECITVDSCYLDDSGMNVIIKLEDIAEKMLKYYWNQLFFFNLKQSPNDKKSPIICQLTNTLIEEYKTITGSILPVWYDKAKKVFIKHETFYNEIVKKISRVLPIDVAWRFKMVNKTSISLYEFDEKKKTEICMNYTAAKELKEYSFILSKLLNYKWAQLLEKFNYAPKIASKVNGISQAKIRRNSLTKYKEQLLKQFIGQPLDFYTGQPLEKDDISVDHVIPWSFMYSDDIWNLVLTSKSNNSSKSNMIPTIDVIERLKLRNQYLVEVVSENYKKDLEEAIHLNYIDKFYYECRI